MEKRSQESLLGYANAEIQQREDDSPLVSNIVKYNDDKITKRNSESDSDAVLNRVIIYTDDEIAKRSDSDSDSDSG